MTRQHYYYCDFALHGMSSVPYHMSYTGVTWPVLIAIEPDLDRNSRSRLAPFCRLSKEARIVTKKFDPDWARLRSEVHRVAPVLDRIVTVLVAFVSFSEGYTISTA